MGDCRFAAGATISRVHSGGYWASNVRVAASSVRCTPEQGKRLQEAVIESYGHDLFERCVAAAADSGEFRRSCVDTMRNHWWAIRNHRTMERDSLWTHVKDLLFTDHVLQAAGVPRDVLRRTTACMSSGCVCSGCDLVTGARIVRSLPTA